MLEAYGRATRTPLSDDPVEQPIRIYALGSFAVLKEDAPLSFGPKPQRKPKNLLKAVLAFGGTDVSCQVLTDALWPEAEGDAARNAFDVTLYRLRKFMQRSDAIFLREGMLSLNPSTCWVDMWEFEQVLRKLAIVVRHSPTREIASLTGQMLELYRGSFLSAESEPWILSCRERLHVKFQRHASMAGERLERGGFFDEAAEIYQRALELDPLAEEFYRRLMICRHRAGRIAEGLAVYRRCSDILSLTSSVQPSEQTRAVYRSLVRQTP